MKIAILDAATLGQDVNLEPLRALGETVEYAGTDPERITERLKDADVAVVNKIKLNGTNLPGTAVRLICVAATGYDNIDTEYCKTNGIALCNVPGYSTDSVAQLTLAMALSLATHLPEYNRFLLQLQSARQSSTGFRSSGRRQQVCQAPSACRK